MRWKRNFLSLGVLCLLAAACSTPKGRIMTNTEQDVVGARRAGAATYDRLVEGAVQKLLALHQASLNGRSGKLKIAFLGIDSRGVEELGDWRAQLYELIDTSVNRSNVYRTVSRRFVEAALRDSRVTRDQLFLPKYRRLFLQSLEAQKMPVDCLLFAKITTGSTRGEGVHQRNYMLTLEMVDVKTGWNDKVSQRIRKEYT